MPDLARHRRDLSLGHPEQHLELEVGRGTGIRRGAEAPLPREQPGVRDVEQVVARDADPHRPRVLGA